MRALPLVDMPSPAVPANRMTTRTYVRNGVRVEAGEGESAGASKKKGKKEYDFTARKEGVEARCRVIVGDCRDTLAELPEAKRSELDLVFADPPFNWNRAYDKWDDALAEDDYVAFTFDWLDLCIKGLRPGGALWVNIPDDWAAEIVCFLKGRMSRKPAAAMEMQNWCVWHYRFGQNAVERFINSKVHALYFTKPEEPAAERRGTQTAPAAERRGTQTAPAAERRGTQTAPAAEHRGTHTEPGAERRGTRTWNPKAIAEMSDRAAIYGDKRTLSKKDGMPAKMRVPMDVWYGQFWGRVQGNNTERRHYHDNQLPEVYLERVVRACSNPEDLVLDPFLGSGTTGVMAHALGRNFIGCEFSAENAKHAVERIQAGPVRLGAGIGGSSAIFEKRRELSEPNP